MTIMLSPMTTAASSCWAMPWQTAAEVHWFYSNRCHPCWILRTKWSKWSKYFYKQNTKRKSGNMDFCTMASTGIETSGSHKNTLGPHRCKWAWCGATVELHERKQCLPRGKVIGSMSVCVYVLHHCVFAAFPKWMRFFFTHLLWKLRQLHVTFKKKKEERTNGEISC